MAVRDREVNNTTGDLFSIDFEWAQKGQAVVQDDISAKASATETRQSASKERLLYTNDKYKFSFEHPKDTTTSFFKEGVEDMALIQSKNGDANAQIFIIPYDEPPPITSARILKDLPDMVIKNEKKGISRRGQCHRVFRQAWVAWRYIRDIVCAGRAFVPSPHKT